MRFGENSGVFFGGCLWDWFLGEEVVDGEEGSGEG